MISGNINDSETHVALDLATFEESLDYLGEDLVKYGSEVTSSIAATVVGSLLGGIPGAVVGALVAPAASRAVMALDAARTKKLKRAARVVQDAIPKSDKGVKAFCESLEQDELFVNLLNDILRASYEGDGAFDPALSAILKNVIAKETHGEERSNYADMALVDAIGGLSELHLRVLIAVDDAGGRLSPQGIGEEIGVPAEMLRSVVRTLELKGALVDRGEDPMCWEIRELGRALVELRRGDNNDE